MKIIKTIKELQQNLKTQELVEFIPTMGNLHSGHLSLVKKAQTFGKYTVVSIFVNNLQFGPNEDLNTYPRTLVEDIKKLEALGVDILFCPNTDEMLPTNQVDLTFIKIPKVSELHCGASRPIFFQGICTIIIKLINIVKPTRIYLGEKDWQQSIIIKKLFQDLNVGVEVITTPIVREESGLACSSRNNKLDNQTLEQAALLYEELESAAKNIKHNNWKEILENAKKSLLDKGFKVDYINLIDANTLYEVTSDTKELRILAAAYLNKVRLIDNISVSIGDYLQDEGT